MLKKLIKHEWKSVSKVNYILLGVSVLICVLGWLSFKAPMWEAAFSSVADYDFSAVDLLGILALITYFLALVVVSYAELIYLGVHFYRSMYTDQGYLTHTLPATPNQIFFSKVLVSSIWYVIFSLMMVLSVVILGASLITTMNAAMGENVLAYVDFSEVFSVLGDELGFHVGGFITVLILTVIISPFTSIIIMFGSFTMGQLAKNSKGVMGFLWYIGINFGIAIILYIGEMFAMVGSITELESNPYAMMDSLYTGTYLTMLIVNIVAAAVLYILSIWINKKKINLN